MLYNSTQNKNEVVSSAQAIAQGISKDGGLFVPQEFPKYTEDDFKALDTGESAEDQKLLMNYGMETEMQLPNNFGVAMPGGKTPEERVLNLIIPKYMTNIIYGAFLESIASENAARMQAMDSATENADDMISSLSLQYNRARQSSITQELTEIIAGAEALQ